MKEMSPYQIRLELLNLAKDNLTEIWYAKKEPVDRDFENEIRFIQDQNIAFPDSVTPFPKYPNLEPFPSEDEIIAKAIRMNDFISNGR
jgi:hypothetical protein